MKVTLAGETLSGSFIYGVEVEVPEDYTMNQLVTAIKERGFKSFMLDTMNRLVKIV